MFRSIRSRFILVVSVGAFVVFSVLAVCLPDRAPVTLMYFVALMIGIPLLMFLSALAFGWVCLWIAEGDDDKIEEARNEQRRTRFR